MNNIIPVWIALRVKSDYQFYKFIMTDATMVNGEEIKNEVKKLMHVTTALLPNNLYGRKLEVFDREYQTNEYSTSDKEFLTRVEYITNEIRLITDNLNAPLRIHKKEEIKKKAEDQIARLSKEYVGRSAKSWYTLLRKTVEREDLLFKEIYKNKNWGLILNSHYGKFESKEVKEKQVALSELVQNTRINIKEKSWIENVDDSHIIVKVSAELDEMNNVEKIKQKLRRRKVELSSTDELKLNKYIGSFTFQTETGLLADADLSIEFEYGKNYTKQLTYTLNAINHDEVK